MFLKVTRGSVNISGITYMAHTSQDTFEVADAEGKRLIISGSCEEIDALPERHVPVASEPSGVIEKRIADLKARVARVELDKAAALAEPLGNVEKLLKMTSEYDSNLGAFRMMIRSEEKKLAESLAAEQLMSEAAAVKAMAATVKSQGDKIRAALEGIVTAIESLDSYLDALGKLSRETETAWQSAGGAPTTSPLTALTKISLPDDKKGALEVVRASIGMAAAALIPRIDNAILHAPLSLEGQLNAKHFKTEEVLQAEARVYEEAHRDDPVEIKVEPQSIVMTSKDDTYKGTPVAPTPAQAVQQARREAYFE